ncbi:hypothetical protein SPHINGO8AM_200033 [Sphingomonas sp. 8AM]|nr:hypothetical protein SPHINGO8AM_200033 [Sphingomonas sp. 8AM]
MTARQPSGRRGQGRARTAARSWRGALAGAPAPGGSAREGRVMALVQMLNSSSTSLLKVIVGRA